MCREGDTLAPIYFPASGGGEFMNTGGMSLNVSLYEDGEQIPLTPTFGPLQGFTLSSGTGNYRLIHHDPLSGTDTTWTYTSSTPERRTARPGYSTASQLMGVESLGPAAPEPLIFLKYDLTTSLHMDNTVSAPGAHRFTVTAYNGQSTEAMPQIEGLKLWTSTDEGESWEPARVIPQGRGTDGERTYRVITAYPKPAEISGVVSLKAEAWDADGNRVEQTILEAFTLRDRAAPAGGAPPAPGGDNAIS